MWPIDYDYKAPVMWKRFPCHDVTIENDILPLKYNSSRTLSRNKDGINCCVHGAPPVTEHKQAFRTLSWCLIQYLLIWWRHQMEAFAALLAICAGNSPVPGEFPTQRPVTRSYDVFFELCLNKWLSKQSWGWWFKTLSRPLWRHRNE